MKKRLDAMMQAVQIVRPALTRLDDSLSDEQRQHLDALGAEERSNSRATASAGPTGTGTIGTLCDRQAESFTQLPAQSIEEVVLPGADSGHAGGAARRCEQSPAGSGASG